MVEISPEGYNTVAILEWYSEFFSSLVRGTYILIFTILASIWKNPLPGHISKNFLPFFPSLSDLEHLCFSG